MWDQERNYHKINVTLQNVSSETTIDTVVVGCKVLLQNVDEGTYTTTCSVDEGTYCITCMITSTKVVHKYKSSTQVLDY